jgi:hypothetical protein
MTVAASETLAEDLRELSAGDGIRVALVDDRAFSATAADAYYDPAERDAWGRVPGSLVVNAEAPRGTLGHDDHDPVLCPIRARESAPNRWERAKVTIRLPVVDDGCIVDTIDEDHEVAHVEVEEKEETDV